VKLHYIKVSDQLQGSGSFTCGWKMGWENPNSFIRGGEEKIFLCL